jgi:hypothetical protein
MGATTFWNSLVLKSKNIALFYITLSVPVSLHLKQITFANDTDSHVKIAKGKQGGIKHILQFFVVNIIYLPLKEI